MELRSSLDKCGHEDLFVDPKWKSIVDVSISWFDCSNDVFQLFPNMGASEATKWNRVARSNSENNATFNKALYLLISVRFVLLSQTVTLTLISFMHHRWEAPQ
jgi:hypothetical protein